VRTFTIRGPQVVHEIIDGEVVIVNLDKGLYFSAEATAAWLWSLITQGAGRDELVRLAGSTYPGQPDVEQQTDRFLAELIQHELIVESEQAMTDSSGVALDPPSVYATPKLDVYSDMEDLLLLDPIHDVGAEEGWPKANA
jgi:hypothetical protein